jgi:hypothetical protein
MQINAEKSPFLTERLKVWMLPTLALIKNEKVEDYVVGFKVGERAYATEGRCACWWDDDKQGQHRQVLTQHGEVLTGSEHGSSRSTMCMGGSLRETMWRASR